MLHHVKNLDATLKELRRVVKPNGTIMLIEHNSTDAGDHLLLDIEHLFYAIIYDKNDNYIKNPQHAKYYNYMEWDYIMKKYAFKYVHGQFLFEGLTNHIRYDNSFYVFYKMSKLTKMHKKSSLICLFDSTHFGQL